MNNFPKSCLVILFLAVTTGAYSQKKNDSEKQYDQLLKRQYELNDSLVFQREKIRLLADELEKNKEMNAEFLAAYSEENEKLREIMRNFILQIDELNNLNLKLEAELNDCKNSND